jgi:hypothetical protein
VAKPLRLHASECEEICERLAASALMVSFDAVVCNNVICD